MTAIDWARPEQLVALDEGWDIFWTGGTGRHITAAGNVDGHDPYEIERDDDAEKFPGDVEAWRHVVRAAGAGSTVHLRALQFLALESPGELLWIADWLHREGT